MNNNAGVGKLTLISIRGGESFLFLTSEKHVKKLRTLWISGIDWKHAEEAIILQWIDYG